MQRRNYANALQDLEDIGRDQRKILKSLREAREKNQVLAEVSEEKGEREKETAWLKITDLPRSSDSSTNLNSLIL